MTNSRGGNNRSGGGKGIDGRGFVVISSLIALIFAIITLKSGVAPEVTADSGLYISSSNLWFTPSASFGINIAVIAVTALSMILCNNRFQFIRNFSTLLASGYMILECCNPSTSTTLINGNIIALVTILSISLLYLSYHYPNPLIQFTIFLLISICSIFEYGAITLMPIFILGVMQMQSISIKGILAIMIGIITPYWILFGMGIAVPSESFSFDMVSIFSAKINSANPLFITNTAILLVTFILLIKNMATIYNYPRQERAYNGVITLLTIWVITMIIIDYNNKLTYIPTLYLCCSIQLAHSYTSSKSPIKSLFVIAFLLIVVAQYIWNII